ncbi:MAG: 23S rRNA (adenine(2503)-C(2))-methyltransferase RlmN [Clostridiales Family XIII bacterium]|nr:23S rRNA (adenine(2503)-C(2))-methyltransferase RlmN [Clostridiales Family XIII bacterium]
MTALKDMGLDELTEYFVSMGEKPYRARQVFKWLLDGVFSFDEMTDLRKELRERLAAQATARCLAVHDVQVSKLDGTRKYLYRTWDGHFVEAVLMEYYFGYSICISTQAGCRMGCRFCASGRHGLVRSLTSGEILDQFLLAERDVRAGLASGERVRYVRHTGDDGSLRIGHIVVMGVGEPMDNYENVLRFLHNITDPNGRNLGRRQITVSTCGLIPGMRRFMRDLPQANLSVSLHAPNDEIRQALMPVGARYGVDEIVAFASEYARETGRRFTFEYALFKGINDDAACARELAGRIAGKGFHVNLIPGNSVPGLGYEAPSKEVVTRFAEELMRKGIRTTTRRELGSDILAACGQLRSEWMEAGEGADERCAPGDAVPEYAEQ